MPEFYAGSFAPSATSPDTRVIVIGAGIIGISIALELQMRGQKVTVLDREGVAAQASQGNAGAFAFSDIIPLATPGIIRKAPKWLLDPLGPLSVPPAYALKIAPWILRFWRASWPDRYEASVAAQTALMGHSRAALDRQIKAVGGEHLMLREGQLQLFEGNRDFASSFRGWELRRQHGVEFDILKGADALSDIQPGLNPRFTHGIFTPAWMNTLNPLSWAEHLARIFRDLGGDITHADVQAVEQSGDVVSVNTAQGPLKASQAVVAAGAWSHHLTRGLGDRLPLETERGYNTTLPESAFDLRTQLTFGGHGFVVSKLDSGLRVGGAAELGGLNLPPKLKRADILLTKAAAFLPELDTSGGKQWMGFRPSMPDSLPVIGQSSRAQRIVYAFGHGHLGLTQSAGTAELVADLITFKTPTISLDAFAPTRFR